MTENLAAHHALCLNRLTLTDFRNHATARFDVDGGTVVLSGPNGSGKTNLLEAVSLLAPGRGLRGAAYDEMARAGGAGSWAIAADVTGPDGQTALGTAWRPQGENTRGPRRRVHIEGAEQRSTGVLAGHMRILWLTPAQDRLFSGPAGERRRFLDRLAAVFDPGHGGQVSSFERTMRERSRLLAGSGREPGWLNALEEGMAASAVAVAAGRVQACDALQTFIDAGRNRSTGFPWARISVDGELEEGVRNAPAVRIEDNYHKILRDSRAADQAAGRALRGPHRSDLSVYHGPKGIVARSCSTGEQKALLIGIVFAHARAVRARFSGWAPVLLLDEITAHLDGRRRAGLFAEIRALACQTWITGTDRSMFEAAEPDAQVINMSEF